MAAVMIGDHELRTKITKEVLEKPKKPTKRKSVPKSKKSESNNDSKKPKIQTGDPKLDLFTTYQPWVIQTYGDLAKTKTITLKKYARILRTLRGEECNSSDSSKFRFWVKAKGFHIGKPPGYDAKPADGIVCRYSVTDAEGCPRGADGNEIYSGSQNDPPLYIPTPPVKVDTSLLDISLSDDSDVIQDLSERNLPEKKSQRRRRSNRSAPYVLNTPLPRAPDYSSSPGTSFSMLDSPTTFLSPPVGIATPLASRKKDIGDIETPQDLTQYRELNENEFEMFGKLIASQLKKLPLSLALDTQLKIQTLVNAARIQAVYQQYSYAGPQDPLSLQAISNGLAQRRVDLELVKEEQYNSDIEDEP